MIAVWHPVAHDPAVATAVEADLHGRRLHVEHRSGERGWRWAVRSVRGSEIATGLAGDAHSAERDAEDEVYKVHPPVGDATGWWLDR
jgi:hypothetical protein